MQVLAKSWFQRTLSCAGKIIKAQGEDYIVKRIGKRQGAPNASRPVTKDEEYVTIRVKSSRIVDIRKWKSTFYGCVQSRVHYLHEDRGRLEYQTVLVPELMKELDPKNLDRTVQIDKPILGPVPYIGELSLELGLFSVKGGDLAGPYIELLTSLTDASGAAFLGQAIPYVEPLRRGADLLFGNSDQSDLEIGLDRSWAKIETGYWILIRAPKGSVSVGNLRVDPNDFRLTNVQGQPYGNHPYLVFAIEASQRRDDWMEIPELKEAWDAIGIAAKGGDLDDAEQLLKQFAMICRWSADLVPDDAKRLENKAKSKLPELQEDTAISRLEIAEHPLGDLVDLNLYDEPST